MSPRRLLAREHRPHRFAAASLSTTCCGQYPNRPPCRTTPRSGRSSPKGSLTALTCPPRSHPRCPPPTPRAARHRYRAIPADRRRNGGLLCLHQRPLPPAHRCRPYGSHTVNEPAVARKRHGAGGADRVVTGRCGATAATMAGHRSSTVPPVAESSQARLAMRPWSTAANPAPVRRAGRPARGGGAVQRENRWPGPVPGRRSRRPCGSGSGRGRRGGTGGSARCGPRLRRTPAR